MHEVSRASWKDISQSNLKCEAHLSIFMVEADGKPSITVSLPPSTTAHAQL
jgi:hypothetical protein